MQRIQPSCYCFDLDQGEEVGVCEETSLTMPPAKLMAPSWRCNLSPHPLPGACTLGSVGCSTLQRRDPARSVANERSRHWHWPRHCCGLRGLLHPRCFASRPPTMSRAIEAALVAFEAEAHDTIAGRWLNVR